MRLCATILAAVLLLAACSSIDNAEIGAELDPFVAAVIACDKRDQSLVYGSVVAAWERVGGTEANGYNDAGVAYDVPEFVRQIAVVDSSNGFNSRCLDSFGFATTNLRRQLVADCEVDRMSDSVTDEIEQILELKGLDTRVTAAIRDAYCAPMPS